MFPHAGQALFCTGGASKAGAPAGAELAGPYKRESLLSILETLL